MHRAHPFYLMFSSGRQRTARECKKGDDFQRPTWEPCNVSVRKTSKIRKKHVFAQNDFSKTAIPGGERQGTEALRDGFSIAFFLYILVFRSALSGPKKSGVLL